jgi:hypothetical protein
VKSTRGGSAGAIWPVANLPGAAVHSALRDASVVWGMPSPAAAPPSPAAAPAPARGQVILFLLLFIPVCLAMTAYGGSVIARVARMERTYGRTGAVVTGSRLETMPCGGTCRGGPSYRPRVTYRYVVDGTIYTSEQVTSLNEAGSASWASGLLDYYAMPHGPMAHYDPANPAAAYLQASRTWPYWLIALAPLGVGLVFGAVLLRRARAPAA